MFSLLVFLAPGIFACLQTIQTENPEISSTASTELLSSTVNTIGTIVPPPAPAPTPKPPANCCPINIYRPTTGMAIFDPELKGCPGMAQFVCGVAVAGTHTPTIITINGNNEIARGLNGVNSRIRLSCRFADDTWLFNENGVDVAVTSIECTN